MVLYINDEHCLSLEQLKGYFTLPLGPQDNIYWDLMDYGRTNSIADWLRENNESELARQFDELDKSLCDSDFFSSMTIILLGKKNPTSTKLHFSDSLIMQDCISEVINNEVYIKVKLKVKFPANETYELKVQSTWGTRATKINPYRTTVGDFITETFHFRLRPNKEFEVVGMFADGEELDAKAVKEKLQGTTSDDDFVDLGLSVKWAKCNLGAKFPEEYGNYYAWGETEPKEEYTEENCTTYGKEISCIGGNPQYDAATAALGEGVRLPNREEIKELADKCNTEWTTQNGVYGRLVTGPNGNSIFLPAAGNRYGTSLDFAGEFGYFWSSSPVEGGDGSAYSLYFDSGNFGWGWDNRGYGRSVRPVREIKV